MKIVAFGELLLRLDTKGHDRFAQAGEFTARYTGGEANVAVALAQWGHEALAVSKVPAHEIGQACINELRRFGVDTYGIARGGDRLGILYVETGASQRPSKVIYDRAASSFREIQPREFAWPAILAGMAGFLEAMTSRTAARTPTTSCGMGRRPSGFQVHLPQQA